MVLRFAPHVHCRSSSLVFRASMGCPISQNLDVLTVDVRRRLPTTTTPTVPINATTEFQMSAIYPVHVRERFERRWAARLALQKGCRGKRRLPMAQQCSTSARPLLKAEKDQTWMRRSRFWYRQE